MVNALSPQRNFREVANYLLFVSLAMITGISLLVLFQFSFPRPQYVYLGDSFEFTTVPVQVHAKTLNGNIRVWVVQTENSMHVFNARTPYYGCFTVWQPVSSGSKAPGYFIDPCTGSSFFLNGDYRYGPSPRALDSYPVKIVEGKVWIDVFSLQEGDTRK